MPNLLNVTYQTRHDYGNKDHQKISLLLPPFKHQRSKTRDVSPCGLVIYIFKNILRQKENYESSNISPHKNIITKKSSKRNQNPLRY
jgi:hypothetical protein